MLETRTTSTSAMSQNPETRLLIPREDVSHPEVSIVVPALNEQLTISDFVKWCKDGLKKAGVVGEIVIVDSSTDKTAELALSEGARVLCTPKRGLGRAYIDVIPFIRGKYIIMGDCDCTYDFRELAPFVQKFHEGYEFVMGSRFQGYIEPGSMPPLHQYLGTPVTTWILNVIYSSRFSDIHCGMRGITLEALRRMGLRSQSWEYASEMVLKSVHMELKTAEVPIRFLKDRDGRLSHHKRSGWLSPWKAAWINLKAMFIYGADFFLLKPGALILASGLAILLPLSFGPLQIGRLTFSLYWMLLGLALSILGLQCVYMGMLAQSILDFTGKKTKLFLKVFKYNPSVWGSVGGFSLGLVFCTGIVFEYAKTGFTVLPQGLPQNHLAVTGLFLMIAAFMNFTFTLVLHAVEVRRPLDSK